MSEANHRRGKVEAGKLIQPNEIIKADDGQPQGDGTDWHFPHRYIPTTAILSTHTNLALICAKAISYTAKHEHTQCMCAKHMV
eukprot:scaffold166452_cov38-Prasinocladus_malaysianus.AAC.1